MYIGVDIGTGSTKIAVGHGDGIEILKRPYPDDMVSGTVHRARSFMNYLETLFSEIADIAGERREEIRGIAADCHGPSLLLLDGQGNALSDIYTWQDTRAAHLEGEIRSSGAAENKHELGFETKALWLYRKFGGTASTEGLTLLSPKDYLIYLLTGVRVSDRATAKTILFYGEESPSNFGLPSDILPRVIEPWEAAAQTGTDFSRAAGLPDGIDVFGGGPDAWNEALGAGAARPGELVEGTGTSTCITVCRRRGEGMNYHVVPDLDMDIQTLSSTGRSLLWTTGLLGEKASKLDELDLREPASLLFLPYLAGERSPIWDPKASGAFIGLKSSTSSEEMLRAAVQGVAFAIRQNLEEMEQNHEVEGLVRAVGGANASEAWLQEKADITGHRYLQMERLDSAPIGSLLLAAYGGGEGDLRDMAQSYNRVAAEYEPRKTKDERMEILYREYTGLYETLKPVMHTLADILEEDGRGS